MNNKVFFKSPVDGKVFTPDKRGMAVLFNLSTQKNEVLNAENNFRFTKLEGQLELF